MNDFIKKLFSLFRKKEENPPKIKVCWDFLALILSQFYLTDDEIAEFSEIMDDHNPEHLLAVIREYVVPYYNSLSPKNQEKIKNTLTYYLNTNSKKLERVFPSRHIPLDETIAKLFYTLVWKELYGTNFPEPINPDDYKEDWSTQYAMSLYGLDNVTEEHRSVYKEPSFANLMARLKQIQAEKSDS